MIIIDLSQLVHAAVHVAVKMDNADLYNVNTIRRIMLSQILTVLKERRRYGDPIVLACDHHSWRTDVFPEYKWSRHENRMTGDIDWSRVNPIIDEIKDEIKDNFPYIVIEVDKAEGDDVVATLARKYGGGGLVNTSLFGDDPDDKLKVLVSSSDKDFAQLHDVIDQYDPKKKGIKPSANSAAALRMQILCGDPIDGIPNILSPDNSFKDKIKQKAMKAKMLESWMVLSKDDICTTDELRRNWDRNQSMVDLSRTPADIQVAILKSFDEQKDKDRHGKILQYFASHKLSTLTGRMAEFL